MPTKPVAPTREYPTHIHTAVDTHIKDGVRGLAWGADNDRIDARKWNILCHSDLNL